jgi:hypothetical protein
LCFLLVAGLYNPSGLSAAFAEDRSSQVSTDGSTKAFEARLPSGITIELLGVSENPSEDKPWWRPDGSPLAERPYKSVNIHASSNKPHIAREFAVSIRNLPSEPVNIQFDIGSNLDVLNNFFPELFSKRIDDGVHAIAKSLPDQPTVTVRIGVSDSWQTIGESIKRSSNGVLNNNIQFSEPLKKGDGISITISHNILDQEMRVVAVSLDGKEHQASSLSKIGFNNNYKINSLFSNLNLKDIRCFRLLTRELKWVEFRNVSLHLGKETHVKIVLKDKPALEESPLPLPRPKRLYPPKIDPVAAGKQAIEKFDVNKDGKISGDELDQVPSLKISLPDKVAQGITAEDIATRIRQWQETKVGLIGSVSCLVVRGGKPVEGAEVKFVPEAFLGPNMPTCLGTTGFDGNALMSKPVPSPDDLPGVPPGVYRVEITKPGEDIPAKFNSQTIYGVEIAPDVVRQPPLIFDIGK